MYTLQKVSPVLSSRFFVVFLEIPGYLFVKYTLFVDLSPIIGYIGYLSNAEAKLIYT